jgi:hypothetical protein
MSPILDPIHDEGCRIIDEATAGNVPLRLLGGVAVRAHAPEGLPPALTRTYQDIDLVTLHGKTGKTQELLVGLGYEANTSFNARNGASRLVFYDREHARQVDVFVGAFRMCHEIPISAERLIVDPYTLPLAELLLTKLQIVALNEKDLCDIYGILYLHEVAEHDNGAVNGAVIARLLAADWGLWRTSTATLQQGRDHLGETALDNASQCLLVERLEQLSAMIETQPKSRRWRMRARVGERVRWYEEPEEIAHQQL